LSFDHNLLIIGEIDEHYEEDFKEVK